MPKSAYPYNILSTPTIGPTFITVYYVVSSILAYMFLNWFGFVDAFHIPSDLGGLSTGVGMYLGTKAFLISTIAGPSQFSLKATCWFVIWWDMIVVAALILAIASEDPLLMLVASASPGMGMILLCIAAIAVVIIDKMKDAGTRVRIEYKEWKEENEPTLKE